MFNFRIIKWLGLAPLIIPKITEQLVTKPFKTPTIDYGGIEIGTPTKVGTHTKHFNDLI